MACIVNIDTSTKVCSVALVRNGEILFSKEDTTSAQHASLLGVFVAEAMEFAGTNDLKPDAVAVGSGPGSYTGLRIGVSEAKGLCYGLNIPLIAIPTLQILLDTAICTRPDIFENEPVADFYCPMIDARRMEVYTAVYDRQYRISRDISADIIDENSFSDYLSKGKVVFFGDGSGKCKPVIKSPDALFLDDVVPLASCMGFSSEKAYEKKRFEDIAYFEPFYLKEFMATIAKNKVLGDIR
ncbi:MAG: tRNA (adenosine(37)-N6)-threonylcarbamoyltransferase complex dimerization subunit type 1 TsaB [Dysgonamonadaceae bacterium]|jgi:tRNA threonylcarbamoyladenosine biosynthesis protein TsaB|nr:tRNA (adenosine(37)-N6)-threonylcarbamoyltransferase complex dimerization subunit type 1 TsaB [Dysgonamonadaceae bacterium]